MFEKEILRYIGVVLFCTLIGWLTNYIAIKLLFYPKNEINILGLKIQGIILKRKKVLIENLSEIISSHLLKEGWLSDLTKNEKFVYQLVEDLKNFIKKEISKRIEEKNFLVKTIVLTIVDNLFETNKEKISEKIINISLHIQKEGEKIKKISSEIAKKIIKENLENMDEDELIKTIEKLIKKELKFLEFLGALIGFILGIFQVLLFI